MKKITTYLLILFMIGATQLFGQDKLAIEGRILDDKNQQPVAFANVSVYQQLDSSLVKGTITNDNGEFEINDLKPSDYYLKVSYIGYENKLIDKIRLKTGENKISLGTIGLSTKENELEEITVKEDKLKGEEKVDRTVYNVTTKVHEVSSTGLDVLKHIPSISVDFQENVTLEGHSDILFFVDDVKRDKDFVAQLDPASIDRVETMTNPSSKYEADVSGVIHIYLKKEKRTGYNARFGVDIPSPPNYIINPTAGLDIGISNVRLYFSDRLHFEKFTGYQEATTIKYSNNTIDRQFKKGNGDLSWLNNNLNYGIDWFINEKNSLNFFGNYRIHQSLMPDFLLDSKRTIDDVLTDHEKINQTTEEKGNSNYFSVYYKRKFEKPEQELSMQADFYDYLGRNLNQYEHTILDLNTDEITDQYAREEITNNHRNSANIRIDYSQGYDKSKIEIGTKTYYQWIDNKQKAGSDAYETKFSYDEIRQAVYVNFTYKFDKLTVQTGLRTEYSKTNLDDVAENEYFCWLPQISIIKPIEKSQNLKLNFRRRIYRPGIDELNPFITWWDSLHFTQGNPDLKPSYSNDAEFVYSKNFKSNMISPKLFAKYQTDDFHEVSFINEDNIMESQIGNIGKSWEYGIGLTYAFQLAKWWRFTGNASVSNKIIQGDNSIANLNLEKQEKVCFRMDANSIMTFFKTWNFMMMTNYRSPYISYQQTVSRDLLWMVAVEKEIIKNGKLQVFYVPPYMKEFTFQKRETRSTDLYDSWEGVITLDYLFAISFNYSFGSGKKVKKLNRSTDIESDGNNSLF